MSRWPTSAAIAASPARLGGSDRASATSAGSAAARLAALMLVSVVVAVLHDPLALVWLCGCALLGCGVAMAQGRLSGAELRSRLLSINGFVALLWVVLPWQIGWQGVVADPLGRDLALVITLRVNAIAGAGCALLAGLDALGLARAAARLGLPHRLAWLLLLMVRYLSVLQSTQSRLERAAQARGFRARPDRRTCEVAGQWVTALLVQAWVRAERVQRGLLARGFDGRFHAPHNDAEAGTAGDARVRAAAAWRWPAATALALLGGVGVALAR